ncbi:NADPH oxidase 5-like isoform X3 [Patiria miniata]|uniref:NADPH oxidase 5 n=1 Tax=Patiria miniata TaxID=46514 RepID=A0A914A4V5_PATMI|nr:NADPH oxidase 5-like isoform X3 [Patiria miniata]
MPGSFILSSVIQPPRRGLRNVLDADTKWLVWAESRIASIAGKDTDIDRESFKNALEVRNLFFADRFFDLFDYDHSGTVSQQEMMDGLFLLTKGTREEKVRFFFDVYDLDESGTIDKDELRALMKTGIDESSLQLSDSKVDHLTDTLFANADQDNDGSISFEEFMTTLRRYPDILENFSISAAAWLKDTRPKKRRCGGIPWLRPTYLRNNIKRIVLMLVILLLTGALFGEAAYRHSSNPDANWCFLIARGCGQALNFNCALIVLMMLRKTLSFLRSSSLLVQILPFDDNIVFHKFIGYLAAILALAHTLGHVGNALTLETYKNFTAVELLFTDPTLLQVGLPVGKLAGSAFITGWILDVVFLVLILGSLSYVRRSGHFEIFYWTHKICYFIFWFLLILHGPIFWAWFLGPLILFLLEKASALQIIHQLRHGKTYVKEANLLPSGVTHLVMTKPRHFKYKAGDYIFVKIPEIAKNEWHPFTISSAPEQTDILCLHIRSAGNWTKRLYRHFDGMQQATIRKRSSQASRSRRLVSSSSSNGEHPPLAGGNLNGGFEMSPSDGEKISNVKPPPVDTNQLEVMDETAVRITPEESLSESGEVDPPTVMKVRRISFNAEVDPQAVAQWRKTSVPLRIPEEIDEGVEEACAIKDERGQQDQLEDNETSPNETGKESDDNATNREGAASPNGGSMQRRHAVSRRNASVSEAGPPVTNPKSKYFQRQLSKTMPRPQILFDMNTKDKIQVHIQGPYGTPSTSVFESDHAVLIGAGIGVTPFASIVQSIMYRHRSIVSRCPNCQHTWVDEERGKQALRVKKVDFIWLNRNHTAFEWFVDMLLNLETEQSQYSLDRFLDIHLFMTSIQRFDVKNFGLQMALDLVHERENRDLLTGLRTKLQAGRPNWNQLFKQIKDEDKGRVSVFFCGAPALGSVISKHCQKFGFIFHKENF